jgi:hypothetical protein
MGLMSEKDLNLPASQPAGNVDRRDRAGHVGRIVLTIAMIVVTAGLIWLTILPAYIAAHRDPHGPSLRGFGW